MGTSASSLSLLFCTAANLSVNVCLTLSSAMKVDFHCCKQTLFMLEWGFLFSCKLKKEEECFQVQSTYHHLHKTSSEVTPENSVASIYYTSWYLADIMNDAYHVFLVFMHDQGQCFYPRNKTGRRILFLLTNCSRVTISTLHCDCAKERTSLWWTGEDASGMHRVKEKWNSTI